MFFFTEILGVHELLPEQARDPNPAVLGVITDGTFANFSELFTTLVVQNVTQLSSDTVLHSYLESLRPCFICFFKGCTR